MPRQIVRVITPGTVGEEMVLTAAEKSYLVAVTGAEGDRIYAGGARRLNGRVPGDAGARGFDAVRGDRADRAARNGNRRQRRRVERDAERPELLAGDSTTNRSAPRGRRRRSRNVSRRPPRTCTNRSRTRRGSRCFMSRTPSATTSRTSRRRVSTVSLSTWWWTRPPGGISS